MSDLIKKTVVICATAGSFLGGAYVTGSGLLTQFDSRVAAFLAAQAQVGSSATTVDANSR